MPIRKARHDTATSAHAEFVAVGDLDPVAVKQALERGFGDWTQPAAATQGGTSYVRVPRPWLAVPPARLVVGTPDKQNAHLQATLALPINDSHPDYAALMLADHLFGSGGNSRLWLRIREQEGLSYDVNSDVQ